VCKNILLLPFSYRNKALEEKMMKMNVDYSKVYEERNELQMMAAMKFDEVELKRTSTLLH